MEQKPAHSSRAADAAASRFRLSRMEEFWFVGLGGTGPFFENRIENRSDNWVVPLWQELFRVQDDLPDAVERETFLSPCHARETEFTCYCGFAARRRPQGLPAGVISFRMPAHEYAVGDVSGGQGAIAGVYRELPDWAEAGGRPVNSALLWLEVYREKPVLDPEGPFSYEVWLPLR